MSGSLASPRLRAVAIAVYAALVLIALRATPLWMDELQHLGNVTNRTWDQMIQWVQINPGAVPLSYMIQEGTVSLIGLSTFAARLSAALASILAALVFVALVRRLQLAGPTVALLIFLITPLQFRYAIEGLGYSLGLLFGLLAYWAFLRLMESPGWTRAALYTAMIALGLYSQPLMLFPVLAQMVWTWKYGTQEQRLMAAVPVGVAVLAFLPWYFPQQEMLDQHGTMALYFFSWHQIRPTVLLHDLVGGGYGGSIPLLVLALYGFWTARRNPQYVLLLGALLAAWAGPLFLDAASNYFFAPRQLLFAVPFLVILAARGASELWSRQRAVACFVMAVFVASATIQDYRLATTPRDDLFAVARAARAALQPDGCVAMGGARAYLTFLEPEFARRECKPDQMTAQIVTVNASWASAKEQAAMIPPNYVKKSETAFRDLTLAIYVQP